MSGLGAFLPKEQDFLIGIFYRVGYWMSYIDDTDVSDRSEQKEQVHMVSALTRVANSKSIPGLVKELAAEALRREGDQKRWLANQDTLLDDVAKAAQMVNSTGTADDYRAFRKAVMFVATSVAKAFREVPDTSTESEGIFSRLLDKAGEALGAAGLGDSNEEMNISPAEDTALHELSAALEV